ncbi:MAG: hypothetical protein ACTSRQ_13685 [Candidatus Thorarchaeota archaeon]
MSSIFQGLMGLGKALASARLWSVLATGLVLLALWGSFVNPVTTDWYFRVIASILIFALLVYLIPKLPS